MTAGLFRGRRDRDAAGRIIPRRLGETRYDWLHYMPFQAKRAPSTRVAVAQNMHMSRDYLQQIEHAAFPLQVEEPSAIGCIYVLRAAGMVEAAVTPSSEPGKGYELAVVHRITVKGRDETGAYAARRARVMRRPLQTTVHDFDDIWS